MTCYPASYYCYKFVDQLVIRGGGAKWGTPFSNVQQGGYLAGKNLLAIVKMIEYINLLLLLTMFGSTCYVYYRLKKIFYLISIVMGSEILDQLTDLGRDVDSEFPKPKRGRKQKADTKMNELEDNDVRDKRERG